MLPRGTTLDLERWRRVPSRNMKWIDTPTANHRFCRTLRANSPTRVPLLIHGGCTKHQSVRTWSPIPQLSNMCSLSTASRVAFDDLTRRCRRDLAECLAGAFPSVVHKGVGLNPVVANHALAKQSPEPRGVARRAVLPRQRARRADALVSVAPPNGRAFGRHICRRCLLQDTGHHAEHR